LLIGLLLLLILVTTIRYCNNTITKTNEHLVLTKWKLYFELFNNGISVQTAEPDCVYRSMNPIWLAEVLSKFPMNKEISFVDLGGGTGLVALFVTMHYGCLSTSIEIDASKTLLSFGHLWKLMAVNKDNIQIQYYLSDVQRRLSFITV